jgi:antirestriction protein ArdC
MNVYEIVTEKIISQLETGTVLWRKPWASVGEPRNLISRKAYRGINWFLLSASKYTSPYWLTYKQATELGGHVRKGEKSTLIVFWKTDTKRDPDAREGEISSADRTRFVLRYYNVFNLEQCELPADKLATIPQVETRENDSITDAEALIQAMPNRPAMKSSGSKAFYSALTDTVTLPPMPMFSSSEEYYATAFHELGHSTGHTSRLGRDGISELNGFGSQSYSKEELVAEMTSAFCCAEVGISPAVIDNQASYIAGWLKKLRDDRRLVVIAAAQAQKAADFILNRRIEVQP